MRPPLAPPGSVPLNSVTLYPRGYDLSRPGRGDIGHTYKRVKEMEREEGERDLERTEREEGPYS